jgi:hypothetical protein
MSTFVQIFAPIFTILLLLFLSLLINLVKRETKYPATIELGTKFTPCASFGTNTSCYIMTYATNNNPYATEIMNTIKTEYKLQNSDILGFQYGNTKIKLKLLKRK